MKLFKHVWIVALLVACVMMLSGSAWADVNSVKQAIEDYGLTASVSGNTITVTGDVSKFASDVLDLGDITGLVIDWKADLTVEGGRKPQNRIGMINFSGNGNFKLTGGIIEIVSADGWVDAIYAPSGRPTVTIDGGTIKSDRAKSTGINIGENAQGTLIIKTGSLNIPRGNAAFAQTLEVESADIITGLVIEKFYDNNSLEGYFYGNVTTVPDSEVFFEKYSPGDWLPGDSISYIAKNGATWNIEGVTSDMADLPTEVITMKAESGGKINLKDTDLTFKGTFHVEKDGELNIGVALGDTSRLTHLEGIATNYGTINIYGTLTNKDNLDNYGTINNYSGNTLDNQGTLTNEGIVNNASTGKITNTGTINNANGKITNDGTIANNGTIKSEAENFSGNAPTGNPVEPLDGNPPPSSGGGCNAGLGIVGLLFAGIVALKGRRA